MAEVDVQVRGTGLKGPHETLEMQVVTGHGDHVFRVSSWWATSRESACEELHESYSLGCSCGFFNTQLGYYQPNALHAALLLVGVQVAYERGLDLPECLERLEGIAFQAFKRIDEGLTKTRDFLIKRSGAPTASQLRKMLDL